MKKIGQYICPRCGYKCSTSKNAIEEHEKNCLKNQAMITFDTNYKPDYSENRLKIIEVPDSVVLTREELEKIIGEVYEAGFYAMNLSTEKAEYITNFLTSRKW